MPLGWNISVYRQKSSGASPAVPGDAPGVELAIWQAGLSGLQWLDELISNKKAIQLAHSGYPGAYTAKAADVLPYLRGEPPDANPIWKSDPGDILTERWLGKTTKDQDAIDACPPEEWLFIEAWDES